ncbi:non-canonical purine NTP pyrophosphatase, RdgB/HAM1 family [Parafrankia soli]|uniref:dITP/XTP pyrophosphatase n=1 Tax=Parafrankia soli TaxID=2599596 RepID=A0A1S1R501_9ACTN|nr:MULTISPECIES: RdgB/HAM1 family non-canonical purine NTP pyrophosphatase [Parafrankia]OHV40986.1 non-canonical purine NTP pyrophosphatase, RdgB/HAM1 family [Parafrankia soli]TCJ34286.1 RdgB/HAM1 family non-canonical purine NTP pyrophosphatase [Parafrankia sp. BMG5.11]CAI7977476.1 deoxyinosine/deoxyxanthosine triphosphate pyrophosphatase, promiscuous (subunit A) [Frankia sp. Hr75.2]SQD93767.1 inosine/xanthosine triphosphate pyrophosphatase (subunit A) [Parafrankia sp. Ea1.12]
MSSVSAVPRQVVLASRNEAKLAELGRILAATGLDVDVVALPDGPEVPETGSTFAENALIKARAAVAATGLAAIADDSGLTVDELAGMPGVRSARWSGIRDGSRADRDAANNALLLAQLDDVDEERRGAAFVCAAALVTPDGVEHVVYGTLRGRLLTRARGTGGFGYDPLFVAEGSTRTNAELTADEKDLISHRGRALRSLAAFIGTLAPPPR